MSSQQMMTAVGGVLAAGAAYMYMNQTPEQASAAKNSKLKRRPSWEGKFEGHKDEAIEKKFGDAINVMGTEKSAASTP